jgi:hypothetical protein
LPLLALPLLALPLLALPLLALPFLALPFLALPESSCCRGRAAAAVGLPPRSGFELRPGGAAGPRAARSVARQVTL